MHIIEIDGVPSTSVDKFVLREDVGPRIEDTSNNACYPDLPPITEDWSKIRPVKEITDADVNALTDEQINQLFADYYAEKARDPLTGVIDVDGVPTHVTYLVLCLRVCNLTICGVDFYNLQNSTLCL